MRKQKKAWLWYDSAVNKVWERQLDTDVGSFTEVFNRTGNLGELKLKTTVDSPPSSCKVNQRLTWNVFLPSSSPPRFPQTYTHTPTVINGEGYPFGEERPHSEPLLFHPDFCKIASYYSKSGLKSRCHIHPENGTCGKGFHTLSS